MFIWENPNWPRFTWDRHRLDRPLAEVHRKQGLLLGRMEGLGFSLRDEAVLQTLTQDVLKTSEIEGEILDPAQVRSSIARRLGMDIGALTPAERHVEGIVEVMLDATRAYQEPLTAPRLFGWHAALFPTGHSGLTKIQAGAWRDDHAGPMQVVSGPIGHERVHFTAPPAEQLELETTVFLHWFNAKQPVDPVLKAGLAHLWFVTIHPFDDGNGRIARAVADMALTRAEQTPQRFYSMSAQIRREREDYYDALEAAQRATLDITDWLTWFLGCLARAIDGTQGSLNGVLAKARFWEQHRETAFNDRQRKVLNRMLDGFDGKLTSSKWAKLTKCSQDTAHRDILDLIAKNILRKDNAGGRSTSYAMVP